MFLEKSLWLAKSHFIQKVKLNLEWNNPAKGLLPCILSLPSLQVFPTDNKPRGGYLSQSLKVEITVGKGTLAQHFPELTVREIEELWNNVCHRDIKFFQTEATWKLYHFPWWLKQEKGITPTVLPRKGLTAPTLFCSGLPREGGREYKTFFTILTLLHLQQWCRSLSYFIR